MENRDVYNRAKKRVQIKVGFYIHLAIYLAVNALLVIINMTTSTENLWFIWPMLGWGSAILFHGLGVFVFSGKSLISQKMIEKEMAKEASKNE